MCVLLTKILLLDIYLITNSDCLVTNIKSGQSKSIYFK